MHSPAPRPSSSPNTSSGLRARADEAVINQWLLDQTPVRERVRPVIRASQRLRGDRPQRFASPRARTA